MHILHNISLSDSIFENNLSIINMGLSKEFGVPFSPCLCECPAHIFPGERIVHPCEDQERLGFA